MDSKSISGVGLRNKKMLSTLEEQGTISHHVSLFHSIGTQWNVAAG